MQSVKYGPNSPFPRLGSSSTFSSVRATACDFHKFVRVLLARELYLRSALLSHQIYEYFTTIIISNPYDREEQRGITIC